jgi:hypothetical protein
MIESIDAASRVQRSLAAPRMTVRRERALAVHRTLIEKSPSPEVPRTDTGCFDHVRLAPHFAQMTESDWAVISKPKA